ncbi:MAG TPA: histidine phosphatase family protein [Anaeromyxobacteraceae bacterium]|nr:histidine phosphatase family protein [Anaeromyxobacteraceae bacterium]
MELLVVRHAVAEDREAWAASGKDDALRPLTLEGARRMKRAARGLARVAPSIDLVASSPLLRAVETARILAPALGLERVLEIPELEPGARPGALWAWLEARRAGAVAVVGHEPHLGRLVAWLVCGAPAPPLPLKKGGACLLRLGERGRRAAELRWLASPSMLRRLGR